MHILKRRKILRSTSLLDLIPVRLVKHETDAEGKTVLLVPKFRNEKFARWFIPRRKSTHYRVRIDEKGSLIWNEMNGLDNIGTILEKTGNQLGPQETERIGKYCTMLYDAGYITFRQLLTEKSNP
jgi:hypothetical protein